MADSAAPKKTRTSRGAQQRARRAMQSDPSLTYRMALSGQGSGNKPKTPAAVDETLIAEALADVAALAGPGPRALLDYMKLLQGDALWNTESTRRGSSSRLSAPAMRVILTGPTGTGKTSAARALAKLFAGMGLLPSPEARVVSRNDFVGHYQGHTSEKTANLIAGTLGMTLCVEDAPRLLRDDVLARDIFGDEAVDELVRAVSRVSMNRGKLAVVLTGHSDELRRGLEWRPEVAQLFPLTIDFPSMTVEDLVSTAEPMSRIRGMRLADTAVEALRDALTDLEYTDHRGVRFLDLMGNTRLVRGIIVAAESAMARRVTTLHPVGLEDVPDAELTTVEGPDIVEAVAQFVRR